MTVRDNVLYVDGRRTTAPPPFELTLDTVRHSGGYLWLDLEEPAESELRAIEDELVLHDLAIEDAIHAHQRSKLERYDNTLFVVLHTAKYNEITDEVDFNELHVFVGPDYVVTIRRGHLPELDRVRAELEADPELLQRGSMAILHAILDMVVDQYRPIILRIEDEIDEIEDQLFMGDVDVSQRVYELSREVIIFQRAAKSLVNMTKDLQTGTLLHDGRTKSRIPGAHDVEILRLMRDVHDHAIHVSERADEFRQILSNALSVQATLVAQEQNEEMRRLSEVSVEQGEANKKIASWAAILFTPSVIAGIYGMNFRHMPELEWMFGYAWALGLMAIAVVTLIFAFRKAGWL